MTVITRRNWKQCLCDFFGGGGGRWGGNNMHNGVNENGEFTILTICASAFRLMG